VTDTELVLKKIAFIEGCVRDLEETARLDLFERDIREQRFVLHTLQLALQATLDIASHIVSARRLGEPSSNRELFLLLGRDGWVTPDQVPTLQAMAGLRNILVHGYLAVDPAIIADVVENHLGDLVAFTDRLRARVDADA
jgi:uncharacterized protein YutE (UPF0331/DUF86 family)